jgi:hypothetical protein
MSENERRLAYARGQFEIAKMYAMYWQAMATTGIATMRNTAQGREPTPEEKERGIVIGWREHSDQEKIKNALETMQQHISRMTELNDYIDMLMSEGDGQ